MAVTCSPATERRLIFSQQRKAGRNPGLFLFVRLEHDGNLGTQEKRTLKRFIFDGFFDGYKTKTPRKGRRCYPTGGDGDRKKNVLHCPPITANASIRQRFTRLYVRHCTLSISTIIHVMFDSRFDS